MTPPPDPARRDDVPQLILASGSPYRAELLSRLGLPFAQSSPDIDERPHEGESPRDYVRRLAAAKARAVSAPPPALVIGSDQAAVLDGRILGKPGSRANAISQLEAAAGRTVRFLTGLCLRDAASGRERTDVVVYSVTFRPLSRERIERYVDADMPFDCAGSFKAEALGITLFQHMAGDDPTALVGLPLIRLVDFLTDAGIRLP